MTPHATLHVAASPVDDQQRCARCGALVLDRRPRPGYRLPRRGFFRARSAIVVSGSDAFTVARYPGHPVACEVPEKFRGLTATDVDFALMLRQESRARLALSSWSQAQLVEAWEWLEAVDRGEDAERPAFFPSEGRRGGVTVLRARGR